MELTPCKTVHGFTVRTTSDLPEIDGRAYVLDHNASRAQLLYLQNDDANKAFSIAFKTPPANDTGVFHILEHSVLCGSDKFPVKEPFVNLLKSSMQTFLNAMTYPDKTIYPVASTNEPSFEPHGPFISTPCCTHVFQSARFSSGKAGMWNSPARRARASSPTTAWCIMR